MEPQQLKWRQYKSYKRLTLGQRIQVIKAYTYIPNYRQLAMHFGCSQLQIRNIMASKDELLQSYENARAKNLNATVDNSNEAKIELLGKVIFEFLLRALNLRMSTDATAIRSKALEVKEALAIENFTPNDAWLHAFKLKHNNVDLMKTMEQLESDMGKRSSLDCNDIIAYVREQQKEEQRKLLAEDKRIAILSRRVEELCKSETELNMECAKSTGKTAKVPTTTKTQRRLKDDIEALVMSIMSDVREQNVATSVPSTSTTQSAQLVEPTEIGIKTEAAANDLVSVVKVESTDISDNTGSITTQKPTTNQPKRSARITNYKEALRYLRVLENFVMTEENYSALSLITQLEYIFRSVADAKSKAT
uniref:HTH CENPB-type domain-containing protein n=1 Tax=Bactrocera latifrons TaxID=174628 RepID=A0A0K8W9T9_BACLA